jgi:hypothetical protein
VCVVPVTGTPGEGLLYPPLAPGQSGLAKKSFALTDQLRSIDKRRIRRVFGELSREEISAIDEDWRPSSALAAGFIAPTRRSSSDPRLHKPQLDNAIEPQVCLTKDVACKCRFCLYLQRQLTALYMFTYGHIRALL